MMSHLVLRLRSFGMCCDLRRSALSFQICRLRPITTLSSLMEKYLQRNIYKNSCYISGLPSIILTDASHVSIVSSRSYAKKKAKKGGNVRSPKHVSVDELDFDTEVHEVIDLIALTNELETALEHLRSDFAQQLALRTSPASFHNLIVKVGKERHPLNELGQVSMKGSQAIVINMASAPQATKDVVQALRSSSMNLNPQQDGTLISVPLPKVTKEHRENLAKIAKTLCNKAKDHMRSVHNKHDKKLRKQSEHHSKDLLIDLSKQVQNIYEEYVSKAEAETKRKQEEILQN